MSDTFLSYAGEDQDRAESLARALEGQGLSVFWDRKLPAGASWRNVIGKELEAAGVVIVIWSVRSVRSEWVLAEADSGRNQGKLVPVVVDDIEPPLGFRTIQSADLRDWDGSPSHPGFVSLIEAVQHLIKRPSSFTLSADLPGGSVGVDPARHYKRVPRASKTRVFVAHASADKPRLKPIIVR